jgi:ATP/maltotriose-dependent transcriptional regulator MalT
MAITEQMPQLRAICLTGLSLIALFRGDAAGAVTYAEERLAVAQTMGDLLGEATALVAIANGALALGDRARAREANALAQTRFHKLGMVEGSATALFNLAVLADGDGPEAADEAARAVHDLVTIVVPCGNPMLQVLGLYAVAGVAAGRGIDDAAVLFGAADRHRPASTALDPGDVAWIEAAQSSLRAACGDEAVATARARGEALSLDDALALAGRMAAGLGSVSPENG